MKSKLGRLLLTLILSSILLSSCKQGDTNTDKHFDESTKIFSALMSDKSGIDFSNNLTENDSVNYFNFTYIYMGGGVATGDINNDGLLDIYFTGNQEANKL